MGILATIFKRQSDETYYEKRRRARHSCAIPTELIDAAGRTWSCKIVDMSESGFGITTLAALRKGSVMNIVKPSIVAEVVWASENKAGLRAVK
jgi:hypothetical protein